MLERGGEMDARVSVNVTNDDRALLVHASYAVLSLRSYSRRPYREHRGSRRDGGQRAERSGPRFVCTVPSMKVYALQDRLAA